MPGALRGTCFLNSLAGQGHPRGLLGAQDPARPEEKTLRPQTYAAADSSARPNMELKLRVPRIA